MRITHDETPLPSGCRPREVVGLITDFVAAFNRGSQDQLSRFFLLSEDRSGPGGITPWTWYSVVEPGQTGPAPTATSAFTAYNVRDLLAYFAQRHDEQERLRLVAVKASVKSGSYRIPGNIWLSFILERQADDLDPRLRFVQGKGAIACDQQQIWRWVMYVPREEDVAALLPCPIPIDWKPEREIVICTAPEL